MKYPAYPKYKPSGVEWLGEVPEHWEVKQLKWAIMFQRGHDLPNEDRQEGDIPLVTSAGISATHTAAAAKGPGIVTGRYGTIGQFYLVMEDYWPLNTTLYSIDLRGNEPRFLQYMLSHLSPLFLLNAVKSAVPGVDRNDIHPTKAAVPPKSEQRAIADFLDRETAKLDTLVAKKRELIEKLKEKRTALISRTVTRGLPPEAARAAGLDPHPKLKPSGIEWLGEVPKHWEVKKIRHLALLKSGENITSDEFEDDGEFPVFGGNGIRGYSSRFSHEGHYVLIGRQGALCGNINYAKGKFWASEHAIVVSPLAELATVWLGELLRSMNLNQYSISAAQPGLSVEMINKLKIPVPPLPEQRAIVDYLDRETAKIDQMTAKVEEAIARLQEYRTALITAAVTGKIEVREYKDAEGVPHQSRG